jgi:copper oxidase (laccase) domain-containing protein
MKLSNFDDANYGKQEDVKFLILSLFGRVIEGIEKSQRVTQCTFCDPHKRFFSYRRDGSQYGTQIGFISVEVTQK